MTDLVILPIYHRTDYISACLEALNCARGIESKNLWIIQDDHLGCPDLEPAWQIAWTAWRSCKTNMWRREKHDEIGYLNNTHDALIQAYESGAERIYYLEDDVVVSRDFFDWHEAVQADGDWMCSSAWRRSSGQNKPLDIAAYYQVEFPTTISIGTCFKRDKLAIALQTHDWNPQDRMKNEGWKCVMPYVQRCYHIGRKSNHPGGNDCPPEAVDVVPDLIPDYGKVKVTLQ